MDEALRAGAAVYNDGHYHAAHDAWEDRWLELESGTDDELLLHGLIQFTAAVHHAHERNWEGTVGLAESAHTYLDPLPTSYRDVKLDQVRAYLRELAGDPEVIERRPPLELVIGTETPHLGDLTVAELAIAARVLAAEHGWPEEPIVRAGEYAVADREKGQVGTPFIALVRDFVLEPGDRAVVHDRLSAHVERRQRADQEVEDLFDGD